MALSGHFVHPAECPLLGVKQTFYAEQAGFVDDGKTEMEWLVRAIRHG